MVVNTLEGGGTGIQSFLGEWLFILTLIRKILRFIRMEVVP
jgi:hypothetical protein